MVMLNTSVWIVKACHRDVLIQIVKAHPDGMSIKTQWQILIVCQFESQRHILVVCQFRL